MIGNVLKFVRQGIWASLSGGWYYDNRFSSFTNIFHLYSWLFLVCFPFALYVVTSFNDAAPYVYVVVLAILFSLLKLVNSYLHKVFDNGEQLQSKVLTQKDIITVTGTKDVSGGNQDFEVDHFSEEHNKSTATLRDTDELKGAGDVAGHTSLWDELVQQDRESKAHEETSKRDLMAKATKAAKADIHAEPLHVMKSASAAGKHNYMRRPKHRRHIAAVDRCGSLASKSTSSDSEFQTDSDSDHHQTASLSSSSGDTERPSTSKGMRNRRTRVGFRNHPRPPRYSGRSLTHLLEQPTPTSGLADDLDRGDGNLKKHKRNQNRSRNDFSTSTVISDLVSEILRKDSLDRSDAEIETLMEFTQSFPAFVNMSEAIRRSLCRVAELLYISGSNTIVIGDNELIDSWMVVIDGQIQHKQYKEETVLSVGEGFGLDAEVTQRSHQGVIKTLCDDCMFLRVPQDHFLAILQQHGEDALHIHDVDAPKKLTKPSKTKVKKKSSSSSHYSPLDAQTGDQEELGAGDGIRQKRTISFNEEEETFEPTTSSEEVSSPLLRSDGSGETKKKEKRPSRTERSSSDSDDNLKRRLQSFKKIPPLPPKRTTSMQLPRTRRPHRADARRRRARSHLHSSGDVELEPLAGRHRHPAGEQTSPPPSKAPSEGNRHSKVDLEVATSGDEAHEVKLHLATTHADTSEGAVHSFQDEHGNWMTYTFASDGLGVASDLTSHEVSQISTRRRTRSRRHTRDDSSSSLSNRGFPTDDASLSAVVPTDRALSEMNSFGRRSTSSRFPDHQRLLLDALRRSIDTGQRMPSFPGADASPSSLPSQIDVVRRTPSPKVKFFYKIHLFPFKPFTIQYDRLALMDLLDRNLHLLESAACVLLVTLVAILGCLVLRSGMLHDIWSLWFCVVIATSQYSLIRSVQPDSASPTHGHNRIIAYSRPVYFILTASLLLICNELAEPQRARLEGYELYWIKVFNNAGFAVARDFLLVLVLLLPVVFLFGLLPQINTFTIYACEQIEMHLFGGVASTSLLAALFGLARSIVAASVLFGFAYGAMTSQEGSQHLLFSAFCGLLVSLSYHLSRQSSSPAVIWSLLKAKMFPDLARSADPDDPAKEADDVSSNYVKKAVKDRLETDAVLCPVICVLSFALHTSSAFTSFNSVFTLVLVIILSVIGFLLHYLLPQLRKNLPWLFFAHPLLKSHEYNLFEVTEAAKLMWFERLYVIMGFIERNILYPVVIMNLLTKEAGVITDIYGYLFGCAIIVMIGLKLVRNAYSVPSSQYLIYLTAYLFVNFDYPKYRKFSLISHFLFSILFVKFQELHLKLNFWLVYVGPWQITWGSAFHAFAQPFAVPHSAFLAAHAFFASLLQAPFTPFLGSAIFLSSYVRPLKFWEKNYNTKRIDHSNTRLANQLDRGPHSDDNNLNSIFYEHLTYSLQKSLAGDISIGRWGNVYSGDCFILASDYLNAMVHIIERGNGVVTFQLRGLEFSGTYCQQREVEAINEGADTNEGCCCFTVRKIAGLLSFNAAFNLRWMAWQVMVSNYVLDGYSITDNNATTMLGVFDLRKILISYIVKSVIYFLIAHKSLEEWLTNEDMRSQLAQCEGVEYADVDPTFAVAIDDDYDTWLFGVSRAKFDSVYGGWIEYCVTQREGQTVEAAAMPKLVTLCFAISVLGRRALGTASNNLSSNLESFLYGLHALFKGDFRITSPKDEWVFADMNLLRQVIAPGVRTALKLHQDHFACPDDYEMHESLHKAIQDYSETMVITHEADPSWRRAVLSNTSSLLALRRVVSETFVDQYSVITLNHRALGFTVVKVNRESVRGLWAGQQNELIFLRNRNPERGSIQNAKQVLRNMINSSCDQPIGYPIYVSPLTSSYATTSGQYTSITGRPITFEAVKKALNDCFACLRQSCSGSCNSGGGPGNPPPQIHSIPMVQLQAGRGASNPARSSQRSEHSLTRSAPLPAVPLSQDRPSSCPLPSPT